MTAAMTRGATHGAAAAATALATAVSLLATLRVAMASVTPDPKYGPVLQGYDVVEFYTLDPDASGVMGSPQFSVNLTSSNSMGTANTTWTYWFKDAANQAKFEADPWAFAPQWGGF